jgi:hypothetical protein
LWVTKISKRGFVIFPPFSPYLMPTTKNDGNQNNFGCHLMALTKSILFAI